MKIFEGVSLGNIELKNRFVRSATFEGMGNEDGSSGETLAGFIAELAEGEVGLIISSHAYVMTEGRVQPLQLGVYKESHIHSISRLAQAAHSGGAKIFLQLSHGGWAALNSIGTPVGPSEMKMATGSFWREVKTEEISGIVDAFAYGAARAMKAGCDGVQLHGAHGFLLNQFLSPYFNKRNDRYGGSLKNRSRILVEILQAVRAVVGEKFPVIIKLNSEDFLEGGFSLEEMIEVSSILEKEGITAVEMSGGTGLSPTHLKYSRPGIQPPEKEVYYLDAAKRFKDRLDLPLILVGGIRTLSVAEEIVVEGIADYIALSRPLIREPNLARKWKDGEQGVSACIHCNRCFGPARGGEGVYCVDYYESNRG